ncbi:P-loop ATPase, Sll1717 family [Nocardioides aequoreus]|uniref:P-loop ATPase, Sll1717 family n=1 Tax=Nocardioides aequoreus TaxID=397278 RepID=UPI0012F6DFEE|nr:hypothetical protein [Nocardioides aequoreus]
MLKDERQELLNRLRFGEDVAEHDLQLDFHFLRTGAFWAVVQDECDLVLGSKGTGKSAIARYLSDPNVEIHELDDVDILPAFNIRGSILFRKLVADKEWEQYDFRDLFLAYIVGLVGNHLDRTYGESHDTRSIRKALQSVGLFVEDPTVQGVWGRALERFRPSTVEAKLKISANPSAEVGGKFDLDGEPDQPFLRAGFDQLELVLEKCYEFLGVLGRRCWVIFDRLDEAFPESRELEALALRGLLQAHLDLSSYGPRLKSKLFLRLDVLDRITERAGLVNASHIRTLRILWDSPSIVHMLALRIDPRISRQNGLGDAALRKIVRGLLPSRIDHQDPLVWLLLVTADGFREFNPRNILYLLRTARLAALQSIDHVESDSVINRAALFSGYTQLSVARLQDTVVAESPELRAAIEGIRGSKMTLKLADLELLIGAQGKELNELIAALTNAGVLRAGNKSEWVIPPLFRPAMYRSVHGAEARIGQAEVAAVADLVAGSDELVEDSSSQDVEPPARKKRSRGRRGSHNSGRDELIPTGQKSELSDDLDVAQSLTEQLGGKLEAEGGESLGGERPPGREAQAKPKKLPAWKRKAPTPSLSSKEQEELALRRDAVHAAWDLADADDVRGGFAILYPTWTDHPAVACVAADLAYRSGEPDLKLVATKFLANDKLSSAGAVLARRIVLALAPNVDGTPSNDVNLEPLMRRTAKVSADVLAIGIVKTLSQAPSREAAFWQTSLPRIMATEFVPGSWIKSAWPILAAGRMLPVFRFWQQADPGLFAVLREVVEQVFDGAAWADSIPRLQGFLYAYSADTESVTPAALPYQVLSMAAVLESKGRLPDSLRDDLVLAIAQVLNRTEPDHLDRFKDWQHFSGIAIEVLQHVGSGELLGEDGGRLGSDVLVRRGGSEHRLRGQEVQPVASSPDSAKSRRQVDPKVLVAVRDVVAHADVPLKSAVVAHVALKQDASLAKRGWAGSGRFGQFVVDYLPELRYTGSPAPGWVYDPARHSEAEIPQRVLPARTQSNNDLDFDSTP